MEAPAGFLHPFKYPSEARERRHGPAGYRNYGEYRPWLEDEFHYRCVYCLKRQRWALTDVWCVDHLVPQTRAPEKICDYSNLILSCGYCNGRKLASAVNDPLQHPFGKHLTVEDDGFIRPLDNEGRILIRQLRLNENDHVVVRRDTLRKLKVIYEAEPLLWKSLMGYPQPLPDLKSCRPPGKNSKPEGIESCAFELEIRGLLPEVYE